MRADPGQCAHPACACRPERDSIYCGEGCEAAGENASECACQHEICVQARAMAIPPDDPLILPNVE